MAQIDQEPRRFSAHAGTETRQQTHDVFGVSFEDAAFDFIDRWAPAADEDGEVQVTVTDAETGERHCFRIDLDSGEAAACG